MTISNGSGSEPSKPKSTDGHSGMKDPIVIVGMACRWPGGASSPDAFWEMLAEGRSAQSKIPKDRFNINAFYHPNIDRPGSVIADGGYFLAEDPRLFDPALFGITPTEALSMDPMQRKFLEVVYECLESSGTTLERVSGSKTACFVGNFNDDAVQSQVRDAEFAPPYHQTGSGVTIISNRINYIFNLKGPSFTIDTACSSSMYALHLACQSINAGECIGAIVGGTNLIQTADPHLHSSKLATLSPTSTCHTFDESADGYGRSDGIGALYIKRLSAAISDGDPIRAIIRGTSFNANGKTAGITHPSTEGQMECMRMAYYQAGGLDPKMTAYVEAHGTGTPTGDPIEVRAIGSFFRASRATGRPLLIGSVKTNIGHTEPSSGIASVMKTVMALEKGLIPATIGIRKLNPKIDFTGLKTEVVTTLRNWPTEFPIRRASVNSFGYGGTNAHAILDAAPNGRVAAEGEPSTDESFALVFSGHSQESLKNNIENVVQVASKYRPSDLTYTLGARRTHHFYRAYGVFRQNEVSQLSVMYGKKAHTEPSIGFVFTGQGALWSGVGVSLLETYPLFRKSLERMDASLQTLPDGPPWKIEEKLRSAVDVGDVQLSQTLCTAVQIAIVDLLESWGITPKVVVGHSSGEIAAAYASARVSAREAIAIAYYRGFCVSKTDLSGAMLAVGLGPDAAEPYIAQVTGVQIACFNSPRSITLSGDAGSIHEIEQKLQLDGIFARKLSTGGAAYHSHHMAVVSKPYTSKLDMSAQKTDALEQHKPYRPMYSSVSQRILPIEPLEPSYWAKNLESPVCFSQSVQAILESEQRPDFFIEIGPHPALGGPLKDIVAATVSGKQTAPQVLHTLKRKERCQSQLINLVGQLYLFGYQLDFKSISSSTDSAIRNPPVVVKNLPSYSWNYTDTFSQESRLIRQWKHRKYPRHDLLGSLLHGTAPGDVLVWRNIIRIKDVPWLEDHKIENDIVYPAAGYIAMAIEALWQTVDYHPEDALVFSLRDVRISTALQISGDDKGVETLLSLKPLRDGRNSSKDSSEEYEFCVSSVAAEKAVNHCQGLISAKKSSEGISSALTPEELCESLESPSNRGRWYGRLSEVGLVYSERFQCLHDIKALPGSSKAAATADLNGSRMQNESRYPVHPTAIDACLQLGIIAAHQGQAHSLQKAVVPTFADEISIVACPHIDSSKEATARSMASYKSARVLQMDTELYDTTGACILRIAGLKALQIPTSIQGSDNLRTPYMRLLAKPDITYISNRGLRDLFPSALPASKIDKHMYQVERLSLAILLQLNDALATWNPDSSDMKKYLAWIGQVTSQDHWCDRGLREMSREEREREINKLDNDSHESAALIALYHALLAHPKETTGLHILFGDEILSNFYHRATISLGGLKQAQNAVDLLCHKNPKMRIFEVGGGTGATTAAILRCLHGSSHFPRYKDYTFTDISPAFLSHAQERFGEFAKVNYGVFDALSSVSEQGYAEHSYDLVIAANVLHATPSLEVTVRNIRLLLKPGGMLLLIEVTTERLCIGALMGVLPQYWDGSSEGRKSSPFVSVQKWNTVLDANGYELIHVLDDFAEPSQLQSVMLAKALDNTDARSLVEHTEGMTAINGTTVANDTATANGTANTNGIANANGIANTNGTANSNGIASAIGPANASGTAAPNDPSNAEGTATMHTNGTTIINGTASMTGKILAEKKDEKELLLLNYGEPTRFSNTVAELAREEYGYSVTQIAWRDVTFDSQRDTHIVSFVEITQPALAHFDELQWNKFQKMLKSAVLVLWVTNAKLLRGGAGGEPLVGMINGIIRSIRIEQPNIAFGMLDFDSTISRHEERSAKQLMETERRLRDTESIHDLEYFEKDGIVHITRIVPDEELNDGFRQSIGVPEPHNVAFCDLKAPRLQMTKVGVFASMSFVEDSRALDPLDSDGILIRTAAVGVNMKDFTVLSGMFEADNFSNECSGTVERVGTGVKDIRVGDRVVAVARGHYGAFHRTKAHMAVKIDIKDQLTAMATMPIIFCTALYSLYDLGQVTADDSVLVQYAAGGLGQAIIQLAQTIGAKLFATVGTAEKKSFLVEQFNIPAERIFVTRDASFIDDLLQTNGGGVDVLITSASGDLSQQIWRTLAPGGRYIDVGRKDAIDRRNLPLAEFELGASFASFDIVTLAERRPRLIKRLLTEMIALYRQKVIKPVSPMTVYDVSELEQAMLAFSKGTRIGKFVISYENPGAIVKGVKVLPSVQLKSDASYLLCGGLGGLGKSLAHWMVGKGAKHFTFLSRSGIKDADTAMAVRDLERRGASVQVVLGDICNYFDVAKAIITSKKPVKGIVQATMVLKDQLLEKMPFADFRDGTRAKVWGTLNLHQAASEAGLDLDFFVMTSSGAGIVGTATQSNYNSGNSFQDQFARYRRAFGLPATAISLGMILDVGHVGEHPEAQSSLERVGLWGIPENEFHGMMEQAFLPQTADLSGGWDAASAAHIVTGFEVHQLAKNLESGFIGSLSLVTDPRFGQIYGDFEDIFNSPSRTPGGPAGAKKVGGMTAKTLKELDDDAALQAFLEIFVERIGSMLFVSAEQLDSAKSLVEYGIDSMIAAELKNWLYKFCKVDMTFLDFLNPETTITMLAEKICKGLKASG